MTRIVRMVVFWVDHDDIGADGLTELLEDVRLPNRIIPPRVVDVDEREVEWHDGRHPLNSMVPGVAGEALEELFGRSA